MSLNSDNSHLDRDDPPALEQGPQQQYQPFPPSRVLQADYEDFFTLWESHKQRPDADLLHEGEWRAVRALYHELQDNQIPNQHLLMTKTTLMEHAVSTIRLMNGDGKSGERSSEETVQDVAIYLRVSGHLGLRIFREHIIPKLLALRKRRGDNLISLLLQETPTLKRLFDREIVDGFDHYFSQSIRGNDRDSKPTPILRKVEFTSSLLLICERSDWRRFAELILRWILREPQNSKKGRNAAFLPKLIRNLKSKGFDFRFPPFEEFIVARVAHFAPSLGPVPYVVKRLDELGGAGENSEREVRERLQAYRVSENVITEAISWLRYRDFILTLATTLDGEALWRRALGDLFPFFTPEYNNGRTVIGLGSLRNSSVTPSHSLAPSTRRIHRPAVPRPALSSSTTSRSHSSRQVSRASVPPRVSASRKRKSREEEPESLLEIAQDFLRRVKRRLF
ncbi:hypothetical protein SISNIDRAFT_466942 [Sistotremastrum niveocremeum HHB9708]|uniref:Uncharacterized protein n=1 Tax=Sistotremastrum niveocremeum HHB9708 TaxID=1314777 RepID=A0A164TSN1_9AGAM|nr:hypothetical protein SISNIDRAFT_466942 [Sistotremastrum niveocremeum HHB9708]